MMSEPTTIAGVDYQIGQLDARRQLHVARRLMPLMGSLVSILQATQTDAAVDPRQAIMPLAEAVSSMPDDDADYIISACLSVVQRKNEKHGNGWSPIQASNGRLMFDDIKLPAMLQITAKVIQENLGPFFSDLGSLTAFFGESRAE